MKDTIVEEVRKNRAQILKECNYDIRSFSELANAEAEQFKKDQAVFMARKRKKSIPGKAA